MTLEAEVTTIDTTTPDAPQAPTGPATRADLIAAAEAAAGADAEGNAPAADAAPPAPTPASETPAPDDDRIGRLLREREKGHAEREAARRSAQALLDEANRERQRIIDEARAEARRVAEEETRARRERFQQSPIEALRELGDPQAVVDHALTANTPEARARAKQEAELAAIRKDAAVGKSAAEELKQFREQIQNERAQAAIEHARTQFLTETASPEKAPYLHAVARAAGVDVFEKCDALCREWTAGGLVLNGTGENGFAPADLVAYLERQSKAEISKLVPTTSPANQVSAGAPLQAPGNAPKVSANGPRTLSAAQGSERRSAPKPFAELSAAEKRQALIDAANEARRAHPNDID